MIPFFVPTYQEGSNAMTSEYNFEQTYIIGKVSMTRNAYFKIKETRKAHCDRYLSMM